MSNRFNNNFVAYYTTPLSVCFIPLNLYNSNITNMNNLLAAVTGIPIDPYLSPGKTVSSTFPTVGSLINVILKNSLTVIGLIMLVLLISGGLMFIISAGSNDSKKSAQAKSLITDALIGFAVVFLAFFIIQIIQAITGLQILSPNL